MLSVLTRENCLVKLETTQFMGKRMSGDFQATSLGFLSFDLSPTASAWVSMEVAAA